MLNRKLKILADENMPMAEAIFSRFGEVRLCAGRGLSAEQLSDADVLLVRSITQVNKALLQGSQVQFVGTATIGTDHIDKAYLEDNDIAFANAPGCNADAVVEYVLSVIYQLAAKYQFDPKERTYGIIGVGNVGGRLQKRFEKLGFKVLLNDPPRAESEAGFSDLDTLLEQADVLCLHTPLTLDGDHPTKHLLSTEQLQTLRKNAIVINAGRGPVIDNTALLKVGQQRSDLLFALDVWEHEPAVNAELAARCEFVSPHIAGYSLDGKIRGTYMLYQALCKHLQVRCEEPLTDFLPEAELSFKEQGSLTALELMTLIYDPQVDDQLLRGTLELPEADQKLAFDQLRKQYRVRREFASLKVANATNPKELSALGFQLAD
ncbi:4-phosphoerythronate dehydrogenase PdxB [Neptuniibacter sp. QD34_54]|uniref:4-phosphoerythronate dehydrogenase PdxB n=1 Tax=Neptuniibacter sp. QD34_54 TaxID=3398208 RepID=UPI0039F5CBAF